MKQHRFWKHPRPSRYVQLLIQPLRKNHGIRQPASDNTSDNATAPDDATAQPPHLPEDKRDGFIEKVSSRYPLSEELTARFGDRWNWNRGLSRNEGLPGSEELIARYEGRWTEAGYSEEWSFLSENEALPWSKELIARYEDRWDWSRLPSDALTQYAPDDIRQIVA